MEKISWLNWNSESFEKAKKENKPILLDIGAVWCYWCMRLDKDTYENDEVINFVNKNFIPIKVDTDKRPDINSRYNLGGWPSVSVLNLDGKLISGTMYLPPSQMLYFLETNLNNFKSKTKINERKFEQARFINENIEKVKQGILNSIKSFYDPYYGGFGTDQKFPFHQVLEFLALILNQDKEAKEILIKTLANMADGEICDQEEGGFYRYSTQQDWSAPHYEKLLDDNSRLIKIYLHTYKLTNIEKFKETAVRTINFVIENFLDKEKNHFYASQEADEEYSKLNLNERKKLKKPNIDKTLFLDFNCYAVQAFLSASEILNNKNYKEIALNCLNFLIKNLISKEGVMHYYDNKPHEPNLLKNNLLLLNTLLETNEEKYIKLAEELAEKTKTNFFSKKEELFYDIKDSIENLGYLKIKKIDPEENSFAIKVFLKLYEKTKNKKYFELAEKLINNIKNYINSETIFSAPFAEAVVLYKKLN